MLANLSNPLGGGASPTTGIIAGGTLYGLNGQTIVGNASGAWAVSANGTNQNITLTPSGTGALLFAGGIQITGATSSATGSGVEIIFSGGVGFVQAYNRDSSGYLPVSIVGSAITLGSGSQATTVSGNLTVSGTVIGTPDARSGAGAVSVTTLATELTSTGAAQAITLADGTNGQIKTIAHGVDGGSMVLTPTTKTGFTTITFTNVGETATLQFFTTRGWMILALFGAVAA